MEQLELARFLENKLGWASLLAVQKGISFSVHDDSLATEFGPGSTTSTYAAELTGSNCFRHFAIHFCVLSLTVCDSYNKTLRSVIA